MRPVATDGNERHYVAIGTYLNNLVLIATNIFVAIDWNPCSDACLCTICFMFCYISWHFYAFSRTNLLTRCHSASSLFFAIFVFQKSYTGNILGIGRNKSRSSYFSQYEMESKAETEGSQGATAP
jgi:hypothetical protein